MNFKNFIIESNEYEKDIKRTIAKLPSKWQKLLKGYKFKFQPGNTLKGDDGHVGVLDPEKKTVTLAAPWRFGREFTLLHEFAHQVWATLSTDIKKEWKKIFNKANKKEHHQPSAEELFCMVFAASVCEHPPVTFHKKEWISFIKKLN